MIALQCCISFWISDQFSLVQSLSRVRLFATPWIAARQASLSITNSRSSLGLKSIESVMPSSHLILCDMYTYIQIIDLYYMIKKNFIWYNLSIKFYVVFLDPPPPVYTQTHKNFHSFNGCR